jgi:hypothetical protein
MEFRIAPMILIVLNILFLINCILHIADATVKQGLIGLGVVLLAFGASKSHAFYSKTFLYTLYSISIICIFMAAFVLYSVWA